jgi:hypothetical protein
MSKFSEMRQGAHERNQIRRDGPLLPEVVCPHCSVTGQVHGQQVKTKKGISGGKATGALLTAGVSVLATGLSRKEEQFEMVCGNCSVRWTA